MTQEAQANLPFANRRVVITGGAGHIGRALTAEIVRQGGRVAIIDRNADDGREIAESLSQTGGCVNAVTLHTADLLCQSETLDAVDRCLNELGGIDALIHNAAFVGTTNLEGWTVPLGRQSPETWRQCMEVNLNVPFYLTQHCLAPLTQSGESRPGGSSVLMIGSIYGMVGPDQRLYDETSMGANPGGYGASKGGLIALTRYLATTMAPAVRVNCLSPGGVFRNQPQKFVERYESRTPLQRMATELDIVGPALFFLGDHSCYVTGQNLAVDGGWTAW